MRRFIRPIIRTPKPTKFSFMGSTPSSMDKPNATQQAKQTANSNDDRLRFLVKYGSS